MKEQKNMRGKGIKWTITEDKAILAGKHPKGRTADQVYNRRTNLLKGDYSRITFSHGRQFIERIEYMVKLGLFTVNAADIVLIDSVKGLMVRLGGKKSVKKVL
jgi:hypothetical protein